MKHILYLVFVLSTSLISKAQLLFTEDFESYQGFGTNLASNWPASGFRVYLSHGAGGSKGCGSSFNNNHKNDSLTSPDLGALGGPVSLTFDARLATAFIGNTATAGYVPTTNDHIWFLYSVDGGPYQLGEEVTSLFTATAPTFSTISVTVPSGSATSMRLKIKVSKAQSVPATDFYMDVDNFAVSQLTTVRTPVTDDYSFTLVPNPAYESCLVSLGENWGAQAKLQVINMVGNVLLQKAIPAGQLVMNVDYFPPGIYVVRIREGNISRMKRLVVL